MAMTFENLNIFCDVNIKRKKKGSINRVIYICTQRLIIIYKKRF